MGCEDCKEIFWGDVSCTMCGSKQVFQEEIDSELLQDEEGSDYLESGGSES